MVTVVFKDAETGENMQVIWHYSSAPRKLPPVEEVFMIQADGEEVDYIFTQSINVPFSGIGPGSLRPCQSWYGDMARFIFANIICP